MGVGVGMRCSPGRDLPLGNYLPSDPTDRNLTQSDPTYVWEYESIQLMSV